MNEKERRYIELINQNQPLIFKLASLYTKNKEDREDLMQEIAFQLWKSFDSFEHRSNISTWMYRIGMNTAIHFLKKERRSIPKDTLQSEALLIRDESYHGKEEEVQQLFQTIHEHLNAMEKGIILLYLEERSHKEIAEVIGISVSNVGTRIQRIKQKLKNISTN